MARIRSFIQAYQQNDTFIPFPNSTGGTINFPKLIESIARADKQFARYLEGDGFSKLQIVLDMFTVETWHKTGELLSQMSAPHIRLADPSPQVDTFLVRMTRSWLGLIVDTDE